VLILILLLLLSNTVVFVTYFLQIKINV